MTPPSDLGLHQAGARSLLLPQRIHHNSPRNARSSTEGSSASIWSSACCSLSAALTGSPSTLVAIALTFGRLPALSEFCRNALIFVRALARQYFDLPQPLILSVLTTVDEYSCKGGNASNEADTRKYIMSSEAQPQADTKPSKRNRETRPESLRGSPDL